MSGNKGVRIVRKSYVDFKGIGSKFDWHEYCNGV